MDWNVEWLFTGGLAYFLVFVNLVRAIIGKTRGRQPLMFASLSFGALAILSEYRMIDIWLRHGEMASLSRSVASLTPFLERALYLGLFLNLLAMVLHMRKEKASVRALCSPDEERKETH
ncbi:MAG: hypothetical protein HFH26_00740 [Clostridiaceae bacterium]|nr:hypothetical protein [Clostridiaceae bacterium]